MRQAWLRQPPWHLLADGRTFPGERRERRPSNTAGNQHRQLDPTRRPKDRPQSLPGSNPAPNDLACRRMTAAISTAIHKVAPPHVRIEPVRRSAKGNLTATAVM